MRRTSTGYYDSSMAGGETVNAFVPAPLPPEPALDLGNGRQQLLEKATLALVDWIVFVCCCQIHSFFYIPISAGSCAVFAN